MSPLRLLKVGPPILLGAGAVCWVPAGVTVTNDVILNNVGMGGFVEFEHYKSHYVCVQLKDHVTLNLTKLSTQNIKYF